MKKLHWWLLALVVAAGLAAGAFFFVPRGQERPVKVTHPPVAAELIAAAQPLLTGLPLAELDAQVQASRLDAARAHVSLFANGERAGSAWGAANDVVGALALAYENARKEAEKTPTTALIAVAQNRETLTNKQRRSMLSNVHRGVHGMLIQGSKEVQGSARERILSPIETVMSNRPLPKQLDQMAKDLGSKADALVADKRVSILDARQFYVDVAAGKPPVELLRGNVLIRPVDVTRDSLQAFARRMSQWMLANVQHDGRMVYLYWPSRGEEAKSNNTIRQLMATICIGRIAKTGEFPQAQEIANRNLRYNVKAFYRERDGKGSIEHDGSSKLGAIALALIAILESPLRPEFQAEEQALRRAMDHLWQPDGAFRTFLLPPDRNDNQNFYPGEALLAWAMSLALQPDAALKDRFLKSFAYYKDWHLDNRNPAFIPWHTQAYYIYYHLEQKPELKDFVFTMNDWLLNMQKRSRVAYDDTLGRFFDPQNQQFGPPHASSTGAYLEGLIDAFRLAREVGDTGRVESYRRSILLGLRDGMQLEFGDEIDMFYVSQREKVHGGLRTTVYDNAIRVDNVQHLLMALQKILQLFTAEDYAVVKVP